MDGYDVLRLCQRKNWFTGGSTESYEKTLECVNKGVDVKIIAYMIWMCSSNVSVIEVEESLNNLLGGNV